MTRTGQLLSDRDRRLIESLVYDLNLEPRFDAIKSCLIWDDELPSGITPGGYKTLSDLWVARAFLHHGFEPSDLVNLNYYKGIWNRAIGEEIRWPGFFRLSLDEKDKALYAEMLKQENPFD